jgi:hypothetical protein
MTRRQVLAVLTAFAGAGLAACPACAMSLDKDQVRCATCDYWEGPRKARAQQRVEVGVAERGRCSNPDSLYRNLWVNPLHFCPQYVVWDQLVSS